LKVLLKFYIKFSIAITVIFCFNAYIYYKTNFNILLKIIILLEKTPSDTCSFCNIKGHWIESCPNIPSMYRNFCFKCWRTASHIAKNCDSKVQKKLPFQINIFQKKKR